MTVENRPLMRDTEPNPIDKISPSIIIEKGESVPGAGRMGMLLFLASLSMLFGASIVGYLVVRFRQEQWPPLGMPSLPSGLWQSTLIISICSVTIQKALNHIRLNNKQGCRNFLLLTEILGVLFLATQAYNWYALVTARLTATVNLYAFTFYMLTGLHALHVIGGLIQLGFVFQKARGGRYSAEWHPGVLYSAMYWHFLDVVWLILFVVLTVAG